MTTRGWPDGDNLLNPVSVPTKKITVCRACEKIGPVTRHHLIPKQIQKGSKCIKLCQSCHKVIHYLPNDMIAKMDADQQINYIRQRKEMNCIVIPLPDRKIKNERRLIRTAKQQAVHRVLVVEKRPIDSTYREYVKKVEQEIIQKMKEERNSR